MKKKLYNGPLISAIIIISIWAVSVFLMVDYKKQSSSEKATENDKTGWVEYGLFFSTIGGLSGIPPGEI